MKHYVLLCTNYLVNVRSFLAKILEGGDNSEINTFVKDLKGKSVAELNEELVAAKKELFNLRFQNATNQLDNTSRIKEVRKNIARIQTVITEASKAE